MKIADVKGSDAKVTVEGKIVEKEEPRDVSTKFGQTKVANAVIEDDSGSMILVLWGDQTQQVSEGDTIRIENGYIREWNGTMQLNVGKFGKLTVL